MAKVSRGGKYAGTARDEDKHFYVHQQNGTDIRVRADSVNQANALFRNTKDKRAKTYRDPDEFKKRKPKGD